MLSLDQNLLVILFPFFFLVIFLFVFGMFRFFQIRRRNRKMVEKIQQSGYEGYEEGYEDEDDLIQVEVSGRGPFSRLFTVLGKIFIGGQKSTGGIGVKFLRGGFRHKNIEASFWGAKIFLPFVFLGTFIVLRVMVLVTLSNAYTISIIVFGTLLAFYLPDIWLKQITDKRKERLLKGLPDSFDLLVICVEAGMGLDSAMKRVGDELQLNYPDLSDELHLLNLEMRAGKQRKEALRNFALRTGLDEIKSLVTLLIQTDKFGTSVATALKVFSDSFRTQRFQKAEEKAAKLPVTILIPLILFIFPALFVIILGPAVINIYHNLLK